MQRALAWLLHEYHRIDIIDEAGCPMTAEIAILNRNAVVLATDSAITSMVPSTSHGSVPKISHNANKLFALSNSDPLAVMIYNDSAFGPVPWETIIKDFRGTSRAHSTVEEHAQQFIEPSGRLQGLHLARQEHPSYHQHPGSGTE